MIFKKMISKWKNKIKEHFEEILRTKPSPHTIAVGIAIGTFISILPTPGLNFALGFLILLIFKRVNKYSLFLALLFWNTITLAPIYILSYKIGNLLFSQAPIVTIELSLLDKVYQFSRRFLIGNLILAVTISITAYYSIKSIMHSYYKKYYPEFLNKKF
jgi:uncharacterized protein